MSDDRDVPWLDPAERAAWMPLHGMLMTLPAMLDAQLQRDAGISLFSYSVMATLSDAPHRTLPMTELAHWTSGSLSRLSHAVTALERKGWVQRRPGAGGRRSVRATLTDDGHARMIEIAPGHVAEVRRLVTGGLSGEEFLELGSLARRVLEGLIGAPSVQAYYTPR